MAEEKKKALTEKDEKKVIEETKANQPESLKKKEKILSIGNWISIFSSLVGLIVILCGVIIWVDKKIANVVEKQLIPYQQLMNGMALANDEEYREAIKVLRPVYKMLRKDNVDPRKLTALLDAYLVSVVYSDEPLEFTQDFNELLPLIETALPRFGWRMHNVGWFFFRTGDLKSAYKYFEKARTGYEGPGDYRAASDTYYSLALVYMAQGNKKLAMENLDIAQERNYRTYNRNIFVADKAAYENDPWFTRLGRQYKPFWPTIREIIDEIEIANKQVNNDVSR